PTKLLADALVEIMKDTGLKRFGLLGHGDEGSTLAMILASEYPSRVSHLVLINPRSAGSAYTAILENVRRYGTKNGNKEVVWGVDNISLKEDGTPKRMPADDAEKGGMGRALGNLRFADPTEPEAGALDYLYDLPGGTQVMNDDKWAARSLFAGKRVDFPVMI